MIHEPPVGETGTLTGAWLLPIRTHRRRQQMTKLGNPSYRNGDPILERVSPPSSAFRYTSPFRTANAAAAARELTPSFANKLAT